MHCDDDLPDCGCRVPLTNTPEAVRCGASASTVRLGCTCPWINTTEYDVSRTSFGYTDKTMSAQVDQNTAGIELDNFLPCDSFALFTEGVVRGGPFDSLMLHIGQNTSNFMLESLSAEFEVVDASTGMTISGACGTITRTRASDEITFSDPFVVRTITGYELDLSSCLTQPLDIGDTVRLTGVGIISNNSLTTSLSPTVNQAIWSVYDDAPELMDFLQCNAINDPISTDVYSMHGIGNVNFNDFCSARFDGLILPGRSVSNNSNANAFPNEFRVVNELDSIVVCAEGGVDESSFMMEVDGAGLVPVTASRIVTDGMFTCYTLSLIHI